MELLWPKMSGECGDGRGTFHISTLCVCKLNAIQFSFDHSTTPTIDRLTQVIGRCVCCLIQSKAIDEKSHGKLTIIKNLISIHVCNNTLVHVWLGRSDTIAMNCVYKISHRNYMAARTPSNGRQISIAIAIMYSMNSTNELITQFNVN